MAISSAESVVAVVRLNVMIVMEPGESVAGCAMELEK